ncbi:MAG: hypothetical protein ACXIT4_07360 [Erythrobacter sp.]
MIYRAAGIAETQGVKPRSTPRKPGNVAFYVDNIWEWLRPENMPSRRYVAFGSPKPEIAAQLAKRDLTDVYLVEPGEGTRFCQLAGDNAPIDARFHPDCDRLKLVIKSLDGAWHSADLEVRMQLAPLFLPCSSKAEIAELMEMDGLPFDPEKIRQESTFWQDVRLFDPSSGDGLPHDIGEVFFEAPYRLIRRA